MTELTEEDKKALQVARVQGRALMEEADAFIVIGMCGGDIRSMRGVRDGLETLGLVGAMELVKVQIQSEQLAKSMDTH